LRTSGSRPLRRRDLAFPEQAVEARLVVLRPQVLPVEGEEVLLLLARERVDAPALAQDLGGLGVATEAEQRLGVARPALPRARRRLREEGQAIRVRDRLVDLPLRPGLDRRQAGPVRAAGEKSA
jgi:hypothetical protein